MNKANGIMVALALVALSLVAHAGVVIQKTEDNPAKVRAASVCASKPQTYSVHKPCDFEQEATDILKPLKNACNKHVYYAPGWKEVEGKNGKKKKVEALVDLSSTIIEDFHKILKDIRANPGAYDDSRKRKIISELRARVAEIRKRETMDVKTRLFMDFNKDENGRPILEGGPDDVMPRNGDMYDIKDIDVLPRGMHDYAKRFILHLREADEESPDKKIDAPKVSNADMVMNAILRADRRYQGKYMPVDSLKGAYRFGGRMKHLDPNLVRAGLDAVWFHSSYESKWRRALLGETLADATKSFFTWGGLIDEATPIEKTRMILKLWNANRALGDRFIHGLKKMDREYSGFLKAPKEKNPGYDIALDETKRYNELLKKIKEDGREEKMYWPDWYINNPLIGR